MLWHFIDGRRHDASSSAAIDVIDPSEGRVFEHLARGDATDIDVAVRAARKAADTSWAACRPPSADAACNVSRSDWPGTPKSSCLEASPDHIRVHCVDPVMAATGLLTEFMGVEDTLENRKRFVATIPMGASRPRTTWSTLVSGSRDDPEFTTDMRIEVDGGRWV